jgi:hypothetical protein
VLSSTSSLPTEEITMPKCPVDGCARYFETSEDVDKHIRRQHSANILDYVEGSE